MHKPERTSAEGSISGRGVARGNAPEPLRARGRRRPQLPSDRPQTPATHTGELRGPPRLPAAHGAGAWRYVAVAFPSPRQPGETEGPELGILMRNQPDIILWGPDYPPTLLPPGYVVLKQYAVRTSGPCRAEWQRTQLQFARDFPPRAVPPHPAPGWVAPDGRFYACRWLAHDRLGYRLAAACYGDPCGPLTLEQRGWLRVQHDGTIVHVPSVRVPSQPQLDVLFTLVQVSKGVYRANIREELELACVLAARDA